MKKRLFAALFAVLMITGCMSSKQTAEKVTELLHDGKYAQAAELSAKHQKSKSFASEMCELMPEEFDIALNNLDTANTAETASEAAEVMQGLVDVGAANYIDEARKAQAIELFTAQFSKIYDGYGFEICKSKTDVLSALYPEETAAAEAEAFPLWFDTVVQDLLAGRTDKGGALAMLEAFGDNAAAQNKQHIESTLDGIYDSYNKGGINGGIAELVYDILAEKYGKDFAAEKTAMFDELKTSKESFTKAVNAVNTKDYKTALEEFAKVSQADTNYSQTKKYMENIGSEMQRYIDEQLKLLVKTGQREAAVNYFNEIKPLIEDKQKLGRYQALFDILVTDTGIDVIYKMGTKSEIEAYMSKYEKYMDIFSEEIPENEYEKALEEMNKEKEEQLKAAKAQEAKRKEEAAQAEEKDNTNTE